MPFFVVVGTTLMYMCVFVFSAHSFAVVFENATSHIVRVVILDVHLVRLHTDAFYAARSMYILFAFYFHMRACILRAFSIHARYI